MTLPEDNHGSASGERFEIAHAALIAMDLVHALVAAGQQVVVQPAFFLGIIDNVFVARDAEHRIGAAGHEVVDIVVDGALACGGIEKDVFEIREIERIGPFRSHVAERDGSPGSRAVGEVVADTPRVARRRMIFLPGVENRLEAIGGRSAPLLAALLLGRRDTLSLRTETLFREAGASHVLALSGMHLGILAAVAAFALRPILGRKGAGLIACLLAVIYTVAVGPRPSLVRAVVMSGLSLAAWMTGLRFHLLELLSATFLVHLLLQPLAPLETGFVLSYAALAGIAGIGPVANRGLRPYLPGAIRLPLVAGLGAQVATLPVVLCYFGTAYPIGMVSGVVLGPLVTLFMVGGAAGLGLSFLGVPSLVRVSRMILEQVGQAIESVAWFFAGSPAVDDTMLVVVAPGAAVALVAALVLEWRRTVCPGR